VRTDLKLPRPEWLRTFWRLGFAALLGFKAHLLVASSAESQRHAETVISPQGDVSAGVRDSGAHFPFYAVLVTASLAVGGWLWVRSSKGAGSMHAKKASIVIEEVRSLGNRQHLILASWRGRSFLLGVSPGRIETIARLPPPEAGQ